MHYHARMLDHACISSRVFFAPREFPMPFSVGVKPMVWMGNLGPVFNPEALRWAGRLGPGATNALRDRCDVVNVISKIR